MFLGSCKCVLIKSSTQLSGMYTELFYSVLNSKAVIVFVELEFNLLGGLHIYIYIYP